MSRTVMARSPLRISFVGGGSDLPGGSGSTFSCAIDKYVYCIARHRLDGKVYLTWREKEIVDSVHDLKHDIVRECLLSVGIKHGVEILLFADIPGVGSGLGSSSATTASILAAVNRLLKPVKFCPESDIVGRDFAEMVCDIELGRLNRIGGKQDQYATVMGGILLLRYRDGDVINLTKRIIAPYNTYLFERNFILFSPADSSVGRDSDSILRTFNNSFLFREECDRLVVMFDSFFMNKRRWGEFGDLIFKHHVAKYSSFSGSDVSYMDSDLNNKLSAIGECFKLCGAGHCGHLLVACIPETREELVDKFSNVWGPELPFCISLSGTEVVYDG